MRKHPSHPGRILLVLLAILVVAGAVTTDVVLQREASRARGALPRAAARLEALAEEPPSRERHEALATAARATGRFDVAGRHEIFAARLSPRDDVALRRSEHALDLALLARVRPSLRLAALGSGLFLLGVGLVARGRARRQQRRDAWVGVVDARIALRVDGAADSGDEPPTVSRDTEAVVVDVFLQPRTPGHRPPTNGPTLSLVLSHALSSTSLRLTPQRDVTHDAVRVRLKDATLARLLARPGPWRLEARLDDRVLGETRLLAAGTA